MASYIEQSLVKGEVILHRFSHHWSAWITFWLLMILGVFTAGITWVIALFYYLNLKGMERAVTSRRIIQKTGVISRRTDEMKLSSVETVEIRQGILDRLLGAGTVKVTGKGISNVVMKNIDDPMAVKRQIEEAEDYQPEPASAA